MHIWEWLNIVRVIWLYHFMCSARYVMTAGCFGLDCGSKLNHRKWRHRPYPRYFVFNVRNASSICIYVSDSDSYRCSKSHRRQRIGTTYVWMAAGRKTGSVGKCFAAALSSLQLQSLAAGSPPVSADFTQFRWHQLIFSPSLLPQFSWAQVERDARLAVGWTPT